jgi:hypothetical protein
MPVQIVDNFDVNSSTPIDNRFVVGSQSFYTHRDYIVWKYVGMRIWDLNDNQPYVWTGSTYSSENQIAITGGGTTNKVPKFFLPTQLTDSLIYDDGLSVAIGTTNPFNGIAGLSGLDVIGRIRSSTGFMGSGQFLQNLNATNITFGTLLLSRLQNGAANQILTSGPGGVGNSTWQSNSSVTVGFANQLQTPRTLWGQSFDGSANVSGNIQNAGTIGFGNFSNKATIRYQSNQTLNIDVPTQSISGTTKTFALLEQDPQTFFGTTKFSKIPQVTSGAYNTGSVQIGAQSQVEFFPFSDSTTLAIYTPSAINPTTTGRVLISNFGALGQYSSFLVRDTHYFNTPSNTGVISFGRTGLNDQIRFFMDGNTNVLSSSGVEIKNNLKVFGSANIQTGLTTNVFGAVTTQTQVLEVNGGTQIKRIVTGTVRIFQNGSTPLIIKGSGFTVASLTSGNTPQITVTLQSALTDYLVVRSIDGDILNYAFSCATQKVSATQFRMVVAKDTGSVPAGSWTGDVEVSFICVGV